MGFLDWFRRRSAQPAANSDAELLAKLASAIEQTRIPYLRIEVADSDAPLGPTECAEHMAGTDAATATARGCARRENRFWPPAATTGCRSVRAISH